MYIIDYNQAEYEHKNIIFKINFNQILQDFINKKIINIFVIYNL